LTRAQWFTFIRAGGSLSGAGNKTFNV